ncbi:MAG: helix-turn-helix domain-containing protein [Bacteroidia bacterium]|nr:helix-turn-helix domain-containing protein [Bacteroidia bacterium]
MNPQITTFDAIAFTLIPGLWLGVLLLLRLLLMKEGPQVANRILAVIICGMTLVISAPLFLTHLSLSTRWHLLRNIGTVSFLYGPGVYFYILASIQKEFQLNRRASLHAVPALFLILMGALASILWDREPYAGFGDDHFQPPLRAKVMAIVLLLHVSTYLFLAGRLLLRHRRFVIDRASYTDEVHSRWLLFVYSLLWIPILSAAFSLFLFQPFKAPPLAPIGSSLMVIAFHVLILFWPQIFRGFPESLRADREEDLEPVRYQSSSLDEELKEKYFRQILRYMETNRLYLKPDLTLSQLAEGVLINQKYISQVINEKSGRNFMDFVNGYRVEAAKRYLLEQQYSHYTIVAIASEVGFHSRSAFYSAFKKFTGMTPSTFRDGETSVQIPESGHPDS